MADASLKIKIGANVGGAVAGVAQVNKSLKDLPVTAKAAGASLSTIKPGADQATFALTSLGRVAQDAPFGFIGIQNNINPLLESFQRLKAETGSTKTALRALGGSLIGAGGLGLAVSLVTSALTFFSLNTRGAKKEIEGFAKAQKEANEEAGEEIARLRILNAVSGDRTRNLDERKRAAGELQKQLKDYNIELSQEAILNGQVADATKKATEAILERAQARAIESRIAELSSKQLELDLKREDAAKRLAKAEKALTDQEQIRRSVVGGGTAPGISGNTAGAALQISNARSALESINKTFAETTAEIDKLLGRVKDEDITPKFSADKLKREVDLLQKRLQALEKIRDVTKDINVLTALEEQIFDLKVKITLRDAAKNGLSKEETDLAIAGFRAQLSEAFQRQAIAFEAGIKVRPTRVELAELPGSIESLIAKATGLDKKIPVITLKELRIKLLGEKITAQIENQEAIINSLKNQLNEIFKHAAVDSFSGLAEGIGQVFAGGGLENIAKPIIGVMGNALQSIGKAAIQAGVELLALKKALLAITKNPLLLIAAGAALVAVGAGIKASIENNVPKFAQGGVATKPTFGVFGEAGPEAIIPLDRLPRLLSQASNNGSITVNGRLTMDSRQLVANFGRAQTAFNRVN